MRLARILFLSCALVALPTAAFAQGKPTGGQTPAKKTLRDELPPGALPAWDRAVMLYTAVPSNPDAAEQAYRQAYEISKNPRVLYNVAVCQKDQKRYALAMKTFAQEKVEGIGKLTPAEVSMIDQNMAALEAYTATIVVDVQAAPGANAPVDGAKLYIEGEEMPGAAPFGAPIRVDAKKLILTVKKTGFKDGTATVELAAGQKDRKVAISLEQFKKDTTKVAVAVSGPPSAMVEIDGKECGPASEKSPCLAEVTYGESHTFRARASGFSDGSKTQVMSTKELTNIALALVPLEGHVSISVLPTDAAIFLDGKAVGSGKWDGVLASGTGHQLRVSKPGYIEHNVEVQVGTGKGRTIQITLNQDRGKATIYSVLGAAAIIAGGGVASYFIFRERDPSYVIGTFNPGLVGTK